MANIFITGSADGLGFLAARALLLQGHVVTLHARNEKRRLDVLKKLPEGVRVLTGDLGNLEETKELALKVNELGKFDTIVHNAGVYQAGGAELFTVNVLAPYILTSLIEKPKRLIYLSSDMHKGGHSKFTGVLSNMDQITYADTKLYVLMLCKAIAKLWPDVYANTLNPGWVPTKMGGRNAPDSLESGYQTQVWLAVSNDKPIKVSGRFFYHLRETGYNLEADEIPQQVQLLKWCQKITGVAFPEQVL